MASNVNTSAKKSEIWKYFALSDDKKKTKCTLCSVALAYSGGTSSMRNHLKHVHKKSNLDSAAVPGSEKRQTSLVNWQRSTLALGQGKYQCITKSLAAMCAVDMRPLSIVNGAGFQRFCRELNPQYHVPSATTISRHVDMLYDVTKDKLITDMSGSDVALTTDCWTSICCKPYITLTGHYIKVEKDWQLKNSVLATRATEDKHTGVNLAQHVTEIRNEFLVQCVPAITTDNAANMLVASKEAGLPHVPCFSHSLQLSINNGLKQQTVAKAISIARKLVGHFDKSSLATQALEDHQKKMGTTHPLHLMQDVCTRWNSSYMMMKRLLLLRVPVYSVLMNEEITKPAIRTSLDLKDNVWKTMEDVVPILEPLAEATQLLTSESTPTCSMVLPVVLSILPQLEKCEENSIAVGEMKTLIKNDMMRRFQIDKNGQPKDDYLNGIWAMSSLLDPRFKSLRFLHPEKTSVVRGHLLTILREGDDPSVTVKTETDVPIVPQTKRIRLLDRLPTDVIDLTKVNSTHASVEHELEQYISEPVQVENPLQWWQANENKFPHIAKLARKYLCIPATEVASERSFSAAGFTVNKLRASLDPENVDKLTFLHKNYVSLQGIDTDSLTTITSNPCNPPTPTASSSDVQVHESVPHDGPHPRAGPLGGGVGARPFVIKQEPAESQNPPLPSLDRIPTDD